MKKIQDIKIETSRLTVGDNFRTIIDDKKIDELSRNISTNGILNPLTIRIVDKKYVVVAGKRRLLAAQKAKLPEVPCCIYEMTDEEADEMQLIENLQREEMHPMDEARGYDKLVIQSKKSLPAAITYISSKVGKPEGYIKKRLRLIILTEAFQELFKKGRIGYDQAILLCRIPKQDQERAMKKCWYGNSTSGAFMDSNQLLQWIQRECFLQMANAPFPLDDEDLFAKAGPCTTCPKRTKNELKLFADMTDKDTCTDSVCFNIKVSHYLTQKRKEITAKAGAEPIEVKAGYGQEEIIMDGKVVPLVNKKQFPDAIPVIVTSGGMSQKSIGKTAYILPGGKKPPVKLAPKEEKQASAEKDRKSELKRVGAQCMHLRVSICQSLFKKFNSTASELKLKYGSIHQLTQNMLGEYGLDDLTPELMVAMKYISVPITEQSLDDFITVLKKKKSKDYEASEKQVIRKIEELGFSKTMILTYACSAMGAHRDISQVSDPLGEVCTVLGFNFRDLKKKFVSGYKAELKKQIEESKKEKNKKPASKTPEAQ